MGGIFFVVVSLLAGQLVRAQNSTVITDVCNNEKKTIRCSSDSVIFIDSARYGRMAGSCLMNAAYGHLNCSADVRLYLEWKCSGRRSCLLETDSVLDNSNHRCPSDLKTYLSVSHHCLRVENPIGAGSLKCDGNYPVDTRTPYGYLARIVTVETRIGSRDCPWSIEARSGQTIRLTLYDFGVWQDPQTTTPAPGDSYAARPMCQVYAMINERSGSPGARTVCGAVTVYQRLVDDSRVVYTSNSNSVQVTVTTAPNPTLEQFLLKYEVVGCADPVPPPLHTQFERNSDRLVIKCSNDIGLDPEPKTWTIQCLEDGNWSTPLNEINCSTEAGFKYKTSSSDYAGSGILVTVAISAAVIVAVLVITCGLFILYRRRVPREEEESQVPLPAGEYRSVPATGQTSGYSSWAQTEGAPYTPGAPMGPWTQVVPWPPGLERRPSADCLERDYATTLQMRLNAMPCSSSSPSISSSHHVPPSAQLGPYGLLPYDPRTMMVYCPFHGTLTRVNGVEPGRPRLRSEHNYEEVPLQPAPCPTHGTEAEAVGDGSVGNQEQSMQEQEQQLLQRQPSGLYHELNY